MSSDTTSIATTQRFNYETNWLGNIKPGTFKSTNSSTTSLPDGIQTIADNENAMTFKWDSVDEFKKWIDNKFQYNGDEKKINEKYKEFLLSADRMDDNIENAAEVERSNAPLKKGDVIILDKKKCLTADTKKTVEELEAKLAEKQIKKAQMEKWNKRLLIDGGILAGLGLFQLGAKTVATAGASTLKLGLKALGKGLLKTAMGPWGWAITGALMIGKIFIENRKDNITKLENEITSIKDQLKELTGGKDYSSWNYTEFLAV